MGNYADNVDRIREKERNAQSQADKNNAARDSWEARGGYEGTGQTLQDYANSGGAQSSGGVATQSFRRRGSTEQSRVGNDTRVRGDATSGTAGAGGGAMGTAMQEASGAATAQSNQNPLWQATRQPVDLASIQQRVLQSLNKPGGQ